MRNDGWNFLIDQVSSFCQKHEICVPIMDELYLTAGRSRRRGHKVTNLHHFRVELFNTVLNMQLQELNDRFSEATTELLICIACLSPLNSFSAFDRQKLIRLATFYPYDFSASECLVLED